MMSDRQYLDVLARTIETPSTAQTVLDRQVIQLQRQLLAARDSHIASLVSICELLITLTPGEHTAIVAQLALLKKEN